MNDKNNNINIPFTSGLLNLIDAIHDRLEYLNGRVYLINTIGQYSLEETNAEIIETEKIRNSIFEAKNKTEMIEAIWTISDDLLGSHIRYMLVEELERNSNKNE